MLHRTRFILLCALSIAFAGGPAAAEMSPEPKGAFRRPTEIPFPPQDPYSVEKATLGKLLFFDPILSGSGTISCATCHNPGLSWGDGLPRAVGEGRVQLALRAPTTLNLAWGELYGWDGKFPDLESVAFAPLGNKANMNRNEAELIRDLTAIRGYREAFAAASPENGAIDRKKMEQAIATYERTIVSGPAPFDHWIDGDESAISEEAKRGFALFVGKGQCVACHTGWNLTDDSFHDVGVGGEADIGRGRLFRNSVALQHAFKTPTLRDVAHRAPYMHDGSVPTLMAVIEIYDRGGIDRPSRDPHIRPLGLSTSEKGDLIAFLETLTGEDRPTVVPRLPR
jgi:cytochrome c peroxidase